MEVYRGLLSFSKVINLFKAQWCVMFVKTNVRIMFQILIVYIFDNQEDTDDSCPLIKLSCKFETQNGVQAVMG